MPLQNFTDGGLPLIHAAWLNEVDALLVTVFQNAETVDEALTALGATTVGKAVLQAVAAADARTALGATSTGSSVFTAATAAAARGALGSTAVGDALFIAATAAAARSAIGATTVGAAVLTAANEAAGRAALGIAYPNDFIVACSDETTNISVANGVYTFRVNRATTLSSVKASLNVASSSGNVTVDVLKNGVSILSTTITIEQNETTSLDATTQPVLSTTALAADDIISINITGAGTGAKGLKVTLLGTLT